MSRSRKKAIAKDHGHRKDDYWRVHRRVNKQIVRSAISQNYKIKLSDEGRWIKIEELPYELEGLIQDSLKDPKLLINDYDYCDYTINFEYESNSGSIQISVNPISYQVKAYGSNWYEEETEKYRRK